MNSLQATLTCKGPNPETSDALTELCNTDTSIRDGCVNVLFKCHQVLALVAWKSFNTCTVKD